MALSMRMIGIAEASRIVGISHQAINYRVKAGTFPRPFRLGPYLHGAGSAKRWFEYDMHAMRRQNDARSERQT